VVSILATLSNGIGTATADISANPVAVSAIGAVYADSSHGAFPPASITVPNGRAITVSDDRNTLTATLDGSDVWDSATDWLVFSYEPQTVTATPSGPMTQQMLTVPVALFVRGLFGVDSTILPDGVLYVHTLAAMRQVLNLYTDIGTFADLSLVDATGAGSDRDFFVEGVGWLVAARLQESTMTRRSNGLTKRKSGDDEFQFADPAKAAASRKEYLDNAAEALGYIAAVRAARLTASTSVSRWFAAGPRRSANETYLGASLSTALDQLTRAPLFGYWSMTGTFAAYPGWTW
jgi:hypothetical protein